MGDTRVDQKGTPLENPSGGRDAPTPSEFSVLISCWIIPETSFSTSDRSAARVAIVAQVPRGKPSDNRHSPYVLLLPLAARAGCF